MRYCCLRCCTSQYHTYTIHKCVTITNTKYEYFGYERTSLSGRVAVDDLLDDDCDGVVVAVSATVDDDDDVRCSARRTVAARC
jgi:hypothetical protein